MCEGLGNVCDGGLAGFDEYEVIVRGAIWLGQLIEHLIHEIVEENFGGLVECSTKRYCMIRVQFGQASYMVWVIGSLDKFVEFDIIFVEV